jgi:hypothetical protein
MQGGQDTDLDQSERHAAAADFVRRFEEFWAAPSRELLAKVIAPDARLVAPMTPTTHTLDDGWRSFAQLLELMPGLSPVVQRWGATTDGVLIEFTMSGSAGGAPISWDAVDRFVLRSDGLATERITYFDSAPLALVVARRPRVWPAFARNQLARGRR